MADGIGIDSAPINLEILRGSVARRRKENFIKGLFFAASIVSILVSGALVFSLIGKALQFITAVDMTNLWTTGWFPRADRFDIKTIIVGTLIISAVGMVVATPLGLGAAIYLSEFAKPRVRRALKPVIEILAGIPSVVVGFFALTFVSPEIVRRIWESASLFNMTAAGIGVGILVTPLVASVAEDALRAVPHTLREASYGMGARKKTTVARVVVPAAVSGIVASLIIGVSRAIGETMVVALVAGGTGGAPFTLNPLDRGQTMTGAMASLAIGSDHVKGADLAFPSLFFVGLVLFLMTLLLNVLSERFVRRVRQKI